MDKLKSTVSYKQFDAPRAAEHAWPILEKMARVKTALSQFEAPHSFTPAAPVEVSPAPVAAAAPTPPAEPTPAGSLFDRLHAEGRACGADAEPRKSASFGRYGAANATTDSPQALSEIFERIGRKAI